MNLPLNYDSIKRAIKADAGNSGYPVIVAAGRLYARMPHDSDQIHLIAGKARVTSEFEPAFAVLLPDNHVRFTSSATELYEKSFSVELALSPYNFPRLDAYGQYGKVTFKPVEGRGYMYYSGMEFVPSEGFMVCVDPQYQPILAKDHKEKNSKWRAARKKLTEVGAAQVRLNGMSTIQNASSESYASENKSSRCDPLFACLQRGSLDLAEMNDLYNRAKFRFAFGRAVVPEDMDRMLKVQLDHFSYEYRIRYGVFRRM